MLKCAHCDEQALRPIYSAADGEYQFPFCCHGCLTVFELLKEKSLTSYYKIKNASGTFKRRSPVTTSSETFNFLDDERFEATHSYLNYEGQRTMDFYLEGIHCLACLWLIEKLPEYVEGVASAKLDIEKSVVSVVIAHTGKFSRVAQELNQLGYRPHALANSNQAKDLRIQEEKKYLKRLGIAGAAAGNIMIYSFSLYAGADKSVASLFNALTVILAIPVFTYSAWPFYQSAITSIRNKTLSIDIPIALSLLMGFIMGGWNLWHGQEENYFDSLTTLVFLLLLSRYFLKKIQDKGLSLTDLHFFYRNESVQRQSTNGFEEVYSDFLNQGDIIKVHREEFIPADGIVLAGSSLMNNSLLTGESIPVKVDVGAQVFSGTQNLGDELIIQITKVAHETRLGKILKNVEQGWALRSRTVDLTSTVAKYFTLCVVLMSLLLFAILLPEGMEIALTRAMTLLIVTCPCALAISVPLTFHRSLSQASKHGIFIKSDEVFEKLAKVKEIFLDKTGTITLGRLQVINLNSQVPVNNIIYSLEKKSRHPVGRALVEFALEQSAKPLEVTEYLEIPGLGVQGIINGKLYHISRGEIRENGKVIATFQVQDVLRYDSKTIISHFKKLGHKVSIISGDRREVVEQVARETGIDNSYAEISPEEKVKIIKTNDSLMVGDGANDAMALEAASVGIAVSGAMDISLRAADVYLTTPGLVSVEKILILSRETMQVVKRNLILSLCYNSLSVVFVFMGMISPLVAAIIMPASSLTVLISTLLGTKKMRSLWKS
ncbi:MAG: cadmium-translocating P-type ATPase [Bacteriovoracaceae bacterium]|nr:cadmium-translocating P-type ATPase [Bacteriovoracaceae bacterium]